MSALTNYFLLSEENKRIVNDMIDKLLKVQLIEEKKVQKVYLIRNNGQTVPNIIAIRRGSDGEHRESASPGLNRRGARGTNEIDSRCSNQTADCGRRSEEGAKKT